VDVRRISARDDGAEYVTLADEMGLALPGERFDGYTATGERYRWLHERMLDYERQLLERHIDLRVYDLPALGNPVVREMMSEHAQRLWVSPSRPRKSLRLARLMVSTSSGAATR
jgi:hypothetical protein